MDEGEMQAHIPDVVRGEHHQARGILENHPPERSPDEKDRSAQRQPLPPSHWRPVFAPGQFHEREQKRGEPGQERQLGNARCEIQPEAEAAHRQDAGDAHPDERGGEPVAAGRGRYRSARRIHWNDRIHGVSGSKPLGRSGNSSRNRCTAR